MKLAGRIPVEPLDEERLTQIERRVVAGAVDAASRGRELRAPGRLLAPLIAVAALAAAAAVGWAIRGAPADPQVAASAPAAAPPVRVQTAAQRSVVDIGDARIESDPDTAFAVTRPGGGVLVAVARGKVELEVGKRGERPPLVVRAGDTDVVVVGTRFSVDYGDGSGDVDVRVTEGVVRVVHLQQETRVAAGQAWRTRAGLIAMAGAPPTTGPGLPRAGAPGTAGANSPAGPAADRTPGGEPARAPTAGAEPARAPTAGTEPARASTAGTEPAHAPTTGDEPPGGLHDHRAAVPNAALPPATSPPPRPAGPARPTGHEPPHSRAAVRVDPRVDLRAAIRAQHIEPALDLGEPDPAGAIARYYDIAAHRSGDEASQAFYSIAWVRYFRQGNPADALQALDAYVRRFPGGKQYRAALWLRVRVLCLDRLDEACRAAAYTYLHEAADAPAAHVAELLTQAQ